MQPVYICPTVSISEHRVWPNMVPRPHCFFTRSAESLTNTFRIDCFSSLLFLFYLAAIYTTSPEFSIRLFSSTYRHYIALVPCIHDLTSNQGVSVCTGGVLVHDEVIVSVLKRRYERKRKWRRGYKCRCGSPRWRGPTDKLNYCTCTCTL